MGFCLAVASLCPAVANEVNWPVACKPVGFVILYRLRRIRAVRLTVRDECVVLGLQTSPKFRTLRLSATVTSKFSPLYHFFPLFFHLPQRFPLNTPPIPHYNYKISFSIPTINFLSTNNYS
jgi:hypothetical protein